MTNLTLFLCSIKIIQVIEILHSPECQNALGNTC